MAILPYQHPVDSAAPLNQITNETMANHASQDSYDGSYGKTIRRTRSLRSLKRQLGSSESYEVDRDSIYNADPVLSRESPPKSSETFVDTRKTSAPATLSLPLSPRTLPQGLSASHSQWPSPRLDTIIEQNSIHSLRTSHSIPKLRASPHRKSQAVQPQTSIHSIRDKYTYGPLKAPSALVDLYHRRSFSLNDLDCSLNSTRSKPTSPHSSSSSDEALNRVSLCPQFPTKPPESPPYRAPTPPGLPSFGTQEATEYRLTQQQSNRTSFWNRIWRHSHDESDDNASVNSPHIGSPMLGPQNHPTNSPGEFFKQTLATVGMCRVISPPPSSSAHPRVSLPPGIHISATPGALARAEDSTFVRGRFGPRASGHGIGQRNLESHPIARMGHLTAIEEQVREIDKACERADEANAQLQRAHERHHQGNFGEFEETPQIPANQAESTGSELHPADELRLSPPIVVSPPTGSTTPEGNQNIVTSPCQESAWLSIRQQRSPPSLSRHRIRGPVVYTPSTLFSMRTPDSTTGGPGEAERTRVREVVLSEKRKEQRTAWLQAWWAVDDCCHEIWHGWYVNCCATDLRG